MTQRIMFGARLGAALAMLLLAGCSAQEAVNAPAVKAGNADFSVYAALGTSISAGTQSSGLVDRHQIHAYTYLFAKQVGVAKFDQPTVNNDGIPALLTIKSFGPPLIINNTGRTTGTPTNATLPTAYHDMGIPFAVLPDVIDTTNYASSPGRALFFPLIQRGRGTPLAQIATQLNPKPTFVTFEYGSNEVLGPTTNGSGIAVIPGAQWAAILNAALNALQASLPGVKVAIFNVPDPTDVPFVRTLPAVQLGANGKPKLPYKPLLGPGSGPGGTSLVPGQDFVLLSAGASLAGAVGYGVGDTAFGAGFPVVGTGTPLPNSMVLSALEVTSIRATVNAYNSAINSEAAARGFAVVDLNGLLHTARTTGVTVAGSTYTSAFITGGLFSLDGVHPNDLAHGLLCNALITSVNATYGSSIPPVDLASAATTRADGALPSRLESPIGFVQLPPESPLKDAVFPWRPGVIASR